MKKISVVILFMLFCAGGLFAEYIYLKNGQEIKGKIVSETDKTVTVLNEATKKRVVLKFVNIADITSTPKSEIEITRIAQSAQEAATQFTSANKTELDGSDTYVQNNKSGVIVYNVKEEIIEKGKQPSAVTGVSEEDDKGGFDAAAYLLGTGSAAKSSVKPAAESKPKPKRSKKKPAPAAEDSGFDAAAYLLGTASAPEAKTAQTKEKKPKEKPAKKKNKEIKQMEEEDYDAAKYLLGIADEPVSAPRKEEKKAKEKPAKKEKKKSKEAEEDYDAARFLLGDSLSEPQSSYKETEKPEYSGSSSALPAETVVSIAFDLKGYSKFSGSPFLTSGGSDFGMGLFLERYGYFCSFAAAGVGAGYEHKRGLEDMQGRFGFIPVYAALKARLTEYKDFNFYAVFRFGYNFMIANPAYLGKADAKGGLYYAFGPGVVHNRVVVQALYSFNNGGMSYYGADSQIDVDLKFSKVSFSVGYMF
ncbi:MAG: hypothetical protein LBR69_01775 [Endomicrobium sp.]|jgi:hypothetical protein|nr:hypothetical protein [Endomicrobium sp.]